QLKDLQSGQSLISMTPAQIPSVQPTFGTTSVDFSTATVTQTVTSTSIATTYTWPDGTVWHITWSIDGTDLVLQTSAQTPAAVPMFSYLMKGTDISNYTLVGLDSNSVGYDMHAPFTGSQIDGNDETSMPETSIGARVALYRGQTSGWFV